MSISVMTEIWRCAPYREGALLVLLAMADWAGDDGGRIYPTVGTLATKARLSVRATQNILRRLEKDGVEERRVGKPRIPMGPAKFLREGQWKRYLSVVSTNNGSDDFQIWEGHPAAARLELMIGRKELTAWFGKTAVNCAASEVMIKCPTMLVRDRIEERYRSQVARAFSVPDENVKFVFP